MLKLIDRKTQVKTKFDQGRSDVYFLSDIRYKAVNLKGCNFINYEKISPRGSRKSGPLPPR